MLTRALYLSAGWFAISLVALLLRGRSLKRGNLVYSFAWLLAVLGIGDLWAYLTFGVPGEIEIYTAIAFLFGVVWIFFLRDWNAFGQVVWSMTLLTTTLFIIFAFRITAFAPLNALSFLVAFAFFFVETAALLLGLTHAYESLDVTTRIRWRRRVDHLQPDPYYTPKVSLQVPTYNEPYEVVARTLQSLARLDYPNYEVLVIDNNTPEEQTWRPLASLVKQLGPNFHFLHLDKWPGYKSGALNFALAQTDPDAEIIGTIDADYQLDPSFLRALVPAFKDPNIAFVQTPQDYRDHQGSLYTEATYQSYRYFFEVSMPSRNEHNAIIFAGTMGLIRKSVLQEIGGWDEWTITEDAEASLRILRRGYQSIYIKHSYGKGLMPFNFEGLKKQRFRWCFGGIQILRKHWESLLPWSHLVDPTNRLTFAQRYYYLVGGLQWFTDVFNLLFAFFLVLGALFSIFSNRFVIRPFAGPLLVVPGLFLLLNIWRFAWVLRTKLNLTWKMALRTMYNFFSLGWVVTLASIQGLVQKNGVFLRTPKAKSDSKFLHAIRVTQWETVIGLVCVVAGVAAFLYHPEVRTFFLGALLFWQASLYLASPYYSLLSITDNKPGSLVHDRGAAVGEQRAARWAFSLAGLAVAVILAIQFIPAPNLPSYTRLLPAEIPAGRLFGIERVPLEHRADTPTATIAPTETPQPPADTPTPGPTSTPPTPTDTPPVIPTTALPLPSATIPVILPSATPLPTLPPAPTATLPPAATLPPTPTNPAFLPSPTLPPVPTPLAPTPALPTPTP